MKKNRTGRLLAGILAAAVVFTSMPQTAYATGGAVEAGQETIEERRESGDAQDGQLGDVADSGDGMESGVTDGETDSGDGTVVDVPEQSEENDGKNGSNGSGNGEDSGAAGDTVDGDNAEDVDSPETEDSSETGVDEETELTEDVDMEPDTEEVGDDVSVDGEVFDESEVVEAYANEDISVHGESQHTQQEAVDWANGQVGKITGQCVRLIKDYYTYLGEYLGSIGEAKNIINIEPPSGWELISKDVGGFAPQPGDIAVWTSGAYSLYGHVGIVVAAYGSSFDSAELNYATNPATGQYDGSVLCAVRSHQNWNGFWGVIRPKFKAGVTEEPPKPVVGEEMKGPFIQTISNGDYHIVSALEGDRFSPGSKCLTITGLPDSKNVSEKSAVLYAASRREDYVFTVKWLDYYRGYSIKLKSSLNQYLDAAGGGLERGTNVQQYDGNNASAQQWVIEQTSNGDGYSIRARCNGFYVDVEDGKTANETNIRLWEGNESKAQRWYFVPWDGGNSAVQEIPNGEYEIVPSLDNSKALSVTSGANVELGTRGSDGKHVFQVTYLGNGYYKMINKNSGLSLDVADAGSKRGANAIIYEYKNTYNQNWIIRSCGEGNFSIVSRCNGLCVDLANGNNGTSNIGTNISMWNYYGGFNQQWRFIPWGPSIGRTVSDGEYQISPKADSSKVATALNGTKSGTNIQLNSNVHVTGHLFTLTYCGDGYYSIVNDPTGLSMDVYEGKSYQGTNVQLWDKLGDVDRQRWMIKPCGDESYQIISKCNGLYLNIGYGPDVEAEDQTNVVVWEKTDRDNQIWKFETTKKPKLRAPIASENSGSEVIGGSRISFHTRDADTLYYTLDGTDPVTSSTRQSCLDSITLPATFDTLRIRAYTVKVGWLDSDVVEFIYKMLKVDPPGAPYTPSGSMVSKGDGIILDKGGADRIYVTVDGTDPRTSSTRQGYPNGSGSVIIITVGSSYDILTIKAYGEKEGYKDSDVAELVYYVDGDWDYMTKKINPPKADIPSGTEMEAGREVWLSSGMHSATIYYTLDGTDPREGNRIEYSRRENPVIINQDTTVKAYVTEPGFVDSDVAVFTYTVKKNAEPEKGKLSAPAASIPSGTEVEAGTQVGLSSGVGGASIYYTLDGTEPGKGSNLYSQPIIIEQDTTVKAIAVKAGWQDSDIAEFTYTVAEKAEPEKEKLSAPTASILSGTEVEAGTQVSLSGGVDGVSIYYTLDGTEPGEGSSLYSQPIVIEQDITIKAVAVKEGYSNSDIAVFVYQVKAVAGPDNPSPENPGQGDVPGGDIPGGDDEDKIPNGLWVAGLAEDGYAYTGKAIKPTVRVYDHKTLLAEKKDYTISYARNTKAYGYASTDRGFDAKMAPTITVKAKGNYSGKETVTFKIVPPDIGSDDFAADDLTVAYKANGVQKPVPVLIWKDKKLKNKTDYTVAYYDSNGNKTDSVKSAGKYDVELTGRGNFGGTRRIELTVTDSLKLMSKVSVSGMKSQPYTGSAITPTLTVKDGGTKLTEGVHYTVSYSQNTEVGTAYAVVNGIEAVGYGGAKRVSFKITGMPITKAAVTELSGQQFSYEGTDITPQFGLNITAGGSVKLLSPETDYTVAWQKNRDAGTATVIFTGKGAYTGTMKKTFRIGKFDIAANAGGRFTAELEQDTVPYAKGGAKPKVVVKFKKSDGDWQTLVEGQDYTLSCQNHTAVNDGSRADERPTVIVKGKGNFSGTFGAALGYKIAAQDIGQLTLTAQDKTYQNKKNIFTTKVTVTDLDGKTLKAGTDYNKNFTYTYKNETAVMNMAESGMTVRAAGDFVGKNDIIPAGTVLVVRAGARDGGNYTGTITGEYRIVQTAISSASVTIPRQTYTGREVTLDKSQIMVKMKGNPVNPGQYEIVPDSYKNNVKKGTASVTIRGVGNYGGTKTVKFSIGTKGFSWWWR